MRWRRRRGLAPRCRTCRPRDEAGLPGFHVATWNALFRAEGGTPKAVIDKLTTPAGSPRRSARSGGGGGRAFCRDRAGNPGRARSRRRRRSGGALNKADIEKWWPLVKAAEC